MSQPPQGPQGPQQEPWPSEGMGPPPGWQPQQGHPHGAYQAPNWNQPPPRKSWFARHKILTVLGGLFGVFVLLVIVGAALGSGGGDPEKVTADPAVSSTPAAPAAETPAAVPPPAPVESEEPVEEPVEEPEVGDDVAQVGAKQGFTYEDGLQVFVTKAERFKIGEYAAGGQPGDVGVKVTVRIVNGSDQAVDLDLASVNLRAGVDGNEADTVFSSDQGLDGGFTGKVAPGRNAQAAYGFAVAKGDLGPIDVEVAPTWDYESVLFQGTVK